MFSTIVGAGVLGLPYVMSRIGAIAGSFFIVGIGLIVMALHLLIGEIMLRTRRHLQLTGVVRKYLGRGAGALMAVVFFLLHMSALVAYLIGEGASLSALAGGLPIFWSTIFFIFGVGIVLLGLKSIMRVDLGVGAITICALVALTAISVISMRELPLAPISGAAFFLPYGVLLFAFHGTAALAEVEMATSGNPREMRRAILAGTGLPIVLYLCFALAVASVTGRETTEVATIGLGMTLSPSVSVLGNAFAAIAMFASFITIGQSILHSFMWDYGLKMPVASALTFGVPFAIFIFVAREFIQVIQFAGAVFGSIEGVLIAIAFVRARRDGDIARRSLMSHAAVISFLLCIVFVIGSVVSFIGWL